MLKIIIIPALILLALYFLKQIINFLKAEIISGRPVFKTVEIQIDNFKNSVWKSGKKNVTKEVETRLGKNPNLSFAKNFITDFLKTFGPKPTSKTKLSKDDELVVAALVKLGFKRPVAIAALKNLPSNFQGGVEEKIRVILKNSGTKQ